MESNRAMDLHVSGIGTASGGTYHVVRVEGVGRIHGDVDCVRCNIEGVAYISGNLRAEQLHISGKANIQGNVAAEEINLEGSVKIDGKCEAESFRASGAFSLDGLLNAGRIDIRLYGTASVTEIGGDSITVQRDRKFSLFSFAKKLVANTIEGDDIRLEYTRAKVVRGNSVIIGQGCEIGRVEYQTELKVAKGAKVGASQKS